MRNRRLLAYLTGVATAAALLTAAGPAAAEPWVEVPPAATPVSSTAPVPGEATSRQITLITGDQVTVRGEEITVEPRDGVHFITLRQREADYVIPSDAIPMLQADRLDDGLFNITGLLEYHFDELAHLPLVVSDRSRVHGLDTGTELAAIDGFATKVPVEDLARTWQTMLTSLTSGKVWLDSVSEPALDTSAEMIGAPEAWGAGLDGTGVTVAVLDSGIDDTHPDLAGKVVARENFVPDQEIALDYNGHGTHVAATIAGSGEASDGSYRGIAPGADLLDGKVCWDAGGPGQCSDSAILQGMQWAVDNGAEVVNMSLGRIDEPGIDPLEQAVNELTAEHGTLFVVAAGNYGFLETRVGSPATADAALAVANFDKAGEVNWGSLPGPRVGDYGVKPDIGAPGTDITAARAPGAGSHLPEGSYVPLTGTSMAAPHVAGAAALLVEAHPDWTAEQHKETLMGSATPNPEYSVFNQGAGLMNVASALDQPVTVTPPSLSLGVLEWPHTDPPTPHTVTYHNHSDAPITVDLALAGDAPDGLLELSAPTLTVPAGGDAAVDLIVDEQATTEYGLYSGYLVATVDDTTVQTPFSVYQEEPAAGLSLSAIDRSGGEPANILIELISPHLDTYDSYWFYEGDQALRLPLNSSWNVTAFIEDEDGTVSFLTHNDIVLDRDQEVVLDARRARPLDVTVPDSRADSYNAAVQITRTADPVVTRASVAGELGAIFTADLGPSDVPGVTTQVQAVFEGPERGSSQKNPDVYHLGWVIEGSFVTGLEEHVSRRDLATVEAEYAQNATGVLANRFNRTVPESAARFPLTLQVPPISTPGRRTEYFAGTDGLQWQSSIDETDAAGLLKLTLRQLESREYQPRHRYSERWNSAVLHTVLGGSVIREGNTVRAQLGEYADAAGNDATVWTGSNHELTLHQEGTALGEFDFIYGNWEVAAEPTTYRMRYALDLPEPFRLSRHLETEWTFTTSAAEQGELPLTSIGFQPRLGLDNTAGPGRLAIPLTFTQQATAGSIRSVRVSVSVDDGHTWTPALATQADGEYTAHVRHHPRESGFASLRATAVDSKGNTVTTTVYRAYELR